MLGRNVHIPFGTGEIYPNQYIMLMGSPGARKGTAIAPGKKLLKAAGYDTFAADAVSKEMFLADMGKKENDDIDLDLETLVSDSPTECFVIAEEFNDFIGQGDTLFITRLTKLWDNLDEFRHPKLHGKSVYVYKPTVSILGANTQQNFSLAIPPEAIGNGFCSRFLFIHAEPTGKFITFLAQETLRLESFWWIDLSELERRVMAAFKLQRTLSPYLTESTGSLNRLTITDSLTIAQEDLHTFSNFVLLLCQRICARLSLPMMQLTQTQYYMLLKEECQRLLESSEKQETPEPLRLF
jgi:hypothetical protein